MQIRSLTMAPLEIPFRQAFTHAAATRATTETVLVRQSLRAGLSGWERAVRAAMSRKKPWLVRWIFSSAIALSGCG